MKLNKFLLVFLSISLSLGFTSCSDDDDDNQLSSETIVGTWAILKAETNYKTSNNNATKIVNELMAGLNAEDETIYTFNADGTYEVEYYPGYFDEGTYRVSGNKLYVTIDGEEEILDNVSIKDNKLTIIISNDINESFEVYDYFNYAQMESMQSELSQVEEGVDLYSVIIKSVYTKLVYNKVV